ncbi:MAG: hypothetical protein H7138_02800 [Myxococcales bacterium]|nr:hypothetical protein [Myxococcales bacterium]
MTTAMYTGAAASENYLRGVQVTDAAGPKAVCDVVYAEAGYSASVTNLSRISLASDNVFSDGATLQIATVTGSVAGDTAALTVAMRT